MTFFYFPVAVNHVNVRVTAMQVCIMSILGCVFHDEIAMHWAIAGLALDCGLRLIYGGSPSFTAPLGLLASRWLSPRFTTGTPKQFATLIATFFSTLAALLFLVAESWIGAVVVLAMLAAASLLEAAAGICLACICFSFGQSFGIIPQVWSTEADDLIPQAEKNFREKFQDEWDHVPPIKGRALARGVDGLESKLDMNFKEASDDWKWHTDNPIRYCTLGDFAWPLGCASLALVWKLAEPVLDTPEDVWVAMSYASAVIFVFVLVINLVRLVLFPRKVWKELQHPVQSSGVSVIFITILIFSGLSVDYNEDLAEVLFWIAAPMLWFLMVFFLAVLIARPHYKEWVNGSWLIFLGGPLVAALIAPSITNIDLGEASYLFFGFPFFLVLSVGTMILHREIIEVDFEPRLKMTLWSVCAGFFLANIAYVEIVGVYDVFGRILYFLALGFYATLLMLCLFANYFGNHPFHRMVWASTFALNIGAYASLKYYEMVYRSDATKFLVYSTLVLATFCCGVCLAYTLVLIGIRHYFKATYKWGPASFMKLTHFAFREGLDLAIRKSNQFDGEGAEEDIRELGEIVDGLALVHHIHQRHEDDILFPYYSSFFPGHTNPQSEQHENLEGKIGELDALGKSLLEGSADAASGSRKFLEELRDSIEEHFLAEERQVIHIPRKYVSLKAQKRLVKKVYWTTSRDEWARVMPLIVRWIPDDVRRIRFLACMRWAVPQEIQRIGMWVYLGLEEYEWDRLASQFPDMIPRPLMGHKRYY